ncbi:MAG: PQQ-binding-like beta-propeller repeat protein [Planctomycetota bacterium]|nr:PQQ-binding-like beta-propeller repeat protein [Planctomycetota bacterium]
MSILMHIPYAPFFTLWLGTLAAGITAQAGEWPQILGPSRTGVAAADEKLAEAWPAGGPPVVWKRDVGTGYAGVAIAGDRGVLFSRRGDREVVEAFDPVTGKTLWSDGQPTTFQPQVGGGDGPLCTPLINAGRVITFGAQGVLSCHDAATGKLLWRRETHRDYGAQEGYFGAGSSPIVVGDVVIVNVGGSRQEAGIVGFALASGETLWKTSAEPASYSSPVAVDLDGEPHVVMITRYQCLLLEPRTGTICWQFPFGMRGPTVNAAMPIVRTEVAGHSLLVTAAYGVGVVEGTFTRDGFTRRWDGVDALASQYCTPIAIGPHVFCIDGRDDLPPADLKCVEITTGRVLWTEKNFGYGTLLAADGKLLAVKTDGELALLRASPEGTTTLAKHRPLAGTLRALPALADGRLYVRNDDTLVCLNLAP